MEDELRPLLKGLAKDTKPKELIETLSEDCLPSLRKPGC